MRAGEGDRSEGVAYRGEELPRESIPRNRGACAGIGPGPRSPREVRVSSAARGGRGGASLPVRRGRLSCQGSTVQTGCGGGISLGCEQDWDHASDDAGVDYRGFTTREMDENFGLTAKNRCRSLLRGPRRSPPTSDPHLPGSGGPTGFGCHRWGTVEAIRRKHNLQRKRLGKRNTKGAKKKLKRIAGKEARFRRHENHVISKAIVTDCQRHLSRDRGRRLDRNPREAPGWEQRRSQQALRLVVRATGRVPHPT